MSQYIRDGKKILQITVEDDVVKHHLMVFASINQAKLYNRTILAGKAIIGVISKGDFDTSEVIKQVAK